MQAENNNHKLSDIELISLLLTEDPDIILEGWVLDLAKKAGLTVAMTVMLLTSIGCNTKEPPSGAELQKFSKEAQDVLKQEIKVKSFKHKNGNTYWMVAMSEADAIKLGWDKDPNLRTMRVRFADSLYQSTGHNEWKPIQAVRKITDKDGT